MIDWGPVLGAVSGMLIGCALVWGYWRIRIWSASNSVSGVPKNSML